MQMSNTLKSDRLSNYTNLINIPVFIFVVIERGFTKIGRPPFTIETKAYTHLVYLQGI